MKKYLLLFLLLIIFIPCVINAEICNQDMISISSIDAEDSSLGVSEINEATASGKIINLNLSMSDVGDNITYKVVVKNDSDEDYKLDEESLNISSDYIDYSIETEDNSNIIKAKSSKSVYLKVNYSNEVPEDKYESGTFNDNKSMMLSLATEEKEDIPSTTETPNDVSDNIEVPNTEVKAYLLVIVIILISITLVYFILTKDKHTNLLLLLIGISIIAPYSVLALCRCDISVNSNIVINEKLICNSFSKDDWQRISKNIKGNNTQCYHVGDTKIINMDEYGEQELRIANLSNPSECSNEDFSKTACGFVVEFSNVVFKNRVKPTPVGLEHSNSNYGGWPISEIRILLNDSFYSKLPEDLRNIIIDTKVISGYGAYDTENFETTDKIFLLTPREIYGDYISGGSYWLNSEGLDDVTRQLDYYKENGITCLNYSGAKKNYNEQKFNYWLRSAPNGSYDYFFYVLSDGSVNTNDAVFSAGISPVFRIG